jgi:hypothetical protein
MKAMGVTYSPLFLTLRYFFSCVLATIYHRFDNGKLFQAPYPCSMLISAFSRSAIGQRAYFSFSHVQSEFLQNRHAYLLRILDFLPHEFRSAELGVLPTDVRKPFEPRIIVDLFGDAEKIRFYTFRCVLVSKDSDIRQELCSIGKAELDAGRYIGLITIPLVVIERENPYLSCPYLIFSAAIRTACRIDVAAQQCGQGFGATLVRYVNRFDARLFEYVKSNDVGGGSPYPDGTTVVARDFSSRS